MRRVLRAVWSVWWEITGAAAVERCHTYATRRDDR